MGDRSPKDKQKKQKQHDKQVNDINRARHERQQAGQNNGQPAPDHHKKAG